MRSRKELIAIYDGLISIASRNIDGQVRVEWVCIDLLVMVLIHYYQDETS